MSNRTATYFKTVGGDSGAVKVGTRWVGFGCLMCAQFDHWDRFFGPTAQRWQGPPSEAIQKVLVGQSRCSNADRHREVLDRYDQLRRKEAESWKKRSYT